MVDLLHRIRVFVFRYEQSVPSYLLLRSVPELESFWTPIHGSIGFGEKLEAAIRREVMEVVAMPRPVELIDLEMPSRWLVGDEEIVEWNFGFRTVSHADELRLPPRWADFLWADFTSAYPSLELDNDRAAITRLHTILHAA